MALDLKKLKMRKPKDVVYADDLSIVWGDGLVGHYPFKNLRDACPCAACVDELTGRKVLETSSIPEDIHITRAEYVGNYAIRPDWSDGHTSGIYSFQFLRDYLEQAIGEGSAPDQPYTRKS